VSASSNHDGVFDESTGISIDKSGDDVTPVSINRDSKK
jgi:hypothetical protein